MKFSIIYIKELSGEFAQIYTIKFDNKEISELQSFMFRFSDSHKEIIDEIFLQIQEISKSTGIQDQFFRRESPENYNVFRILNRGTLRLYCLKLENIVLIFGSGKKKRFKTKKLRENPQLVDFVRQLEQVEDAINIRKNQGQIRIDQNGISGNLLDFEFKE